MESGGNIPHLAEHNEDEGGEQRGYVQATDYSLPYMSRSSRLHWKDVSRDLLRHVNCGYLSTPGVPPTLLALKQHAQSLCILIHMLCPTLCSGEIANGIPSNTFWGWQGKSPTLLFSTDLKHRREKEKAELKEYILDFKYELNDVFDFLSDMTKDYENADPNHHKPLVGLCNEVSSRHEAYGTKYHCPLAEAQLLGKNETIKPSFNTHNLVMHTTPA